MSGSRIIDSFGQYNYFLVKSDNELSGRIFNKINCVDDLLILTMYYAGRYYIRFKDIEYQDDTYTVLDLFGNRDVIYGHKDPPKQKVYKYENSTEINDLSDIFLQELIDENRSSDDFIVLNLHKFGKLTDLQQVHLERIINEMPEALTSKTREERTIFLRKEGKRVMCGLYGLQSETGFKEKLLDKCSREYDNAYRMFYPN